MWTIDLGTIIPANLPEDQTGRIQRMAVEAFRALDIAGMARVDFLLEGQTERLYLNEVNTIPGFTTIQYVLQDVASLGLVLLSTHRSIDRART